MSRDPLLAPKAAAECIGQAVNQLETMRAQGTGPAWVSPSPDCVQYRLSSLTKWIRKGI